MKRIALLASKNERVFHIQDLANLWSVSNRQTLRVCLSRYVKNGLIYAIYRGFYSLVPLGELDPLLLGFKALHGAAYFSMESVLYREGFISQKIDYFTFVSQKSLRFTIGDSDFVSRQLNDRFLYNSDGVLVKNGLRIATLERAIADMLYFNLKYHFDHPVDWKKIKALQKKIGYPLTPGRYEIGKKQ